MKVPQLSSTNAHRNQFGSFQELPLPLTHIMCVGRVEVKHAPWSKLGPPVPSSKVINETQRHVDSKKRTH